jgi:integrase/recombinase XerD
MNQLTDPKSGTVATLLPPVPRMIIEAGTPAEYCWSEYFSATIRNPHTRRAYRRAVTRFMKWVEPFHVTLDRITPALVAQFIDEYPGSAPSRKLALAAIRSLFDLMTVRHVVFMNPASSVRGERYSVVEGKTPEISKEQARLLLASIDTSTPVGLRDRAICGVLIYTAARAGAVASLRLKDFTFDGTQYSFRFREKGGKSRAIPCRADLQEFLLAYLELIDWKNASKESPLFRSVAGRTNVFTLKSIRSIDIYRMLKRRLLDAGLPTIFSPHSFRVTTLTDLLEQGVPLEDAQYLAGHADPRTTRLYDRRKKKVTRNMVERISI